MPPRRPKPSTAELEILRVLWRQGPSTVHQIHPELARGSRVGYTTVLKLLQIMFEKGLVTRNDASRPHVFKAAVAEGQVKRRLLTELLDQVFDGSTTSLVMHTLSAKRATPEEVRQLRQMLDDLEGGK
jgi:BlaI family transcriptional regulator, penicillinase repressor